MGDARRDAVSGHLSGHAGVADKPNQGAIHCTGFMEHLMKPQNANDRRGFCNCWNLGLSQLHEEALVGRGSTARRFYFAFDGRFGAGCVLRTASASISRSSAFV